MPQIEVRPFERRDLKRIAEIERGSFGKGAWPAQAFLEYSHHSPELFFVARYGRRIAGYSVTRVNWRGAELDSIAVDERYRGHGIAQALMNATLAALRSQSASTLRLMVSTNNTPALRFYRQYGFIRTRLVKRYYGASGDAWRMRLDVGRSRPNQEAGKKE